MKRGQTRGARPRMGRLAAMLVVLATSAGGAAEAAPPRPTVLLSGVYLHGYLKGADAAVRIVNTDRDRPVSLAGLALTDAFTPRKVRKGRKAKDDGGFGAGLPDFTADVAADADADKPKRSRGRPATDCTLRFPRGAAIPAGGEIWVAATGRGFRQVFGEAPAFESEPTDDAVPDLDPTGCFLWLNEGYGTVGLLDAREEIIDFVAFQGPGQDGFPDGSLDGVPWTGAPVALKENTPYGWTGRVLGRARDEAGRVLADRDTAADWPAGFSRMTLGEMPTHRVEFAGQSRFLATPLRGVKARVVATSSPDNSYSALIEAFDSAKKELRVRVYELTGPKITEALIRTRQRGVKVLVFLEGAPVGGLSDQGRWLVDRLVKADIPVHFLGVPEDAAIRPRYRFDHSKYVIVDDRRVVIGTENYGRTGVPVIPTYGNRGYMVHVEEPTFVRQLRAVWDHDYRPGVLGDVLSEDASPSDKFGLPYRDPAFVPSESIPQGSYADPARAAVVEGPMDLELVLSPDTSLNETTSIIGMINRAKHTLYLEQNSIVPYWGMKGKMLKPGEKRDIAGEQGLVPSLPMQAVIAAARRGVSVRVLMDGTWYNAEVTDEGDNDNTAALLNALAEREGLDLSAKVINLEATHLSKIHAKGVLIDDREVFVGSINWSENAFEGNREVGVIVGHPKVAGYYADLFRRDWLQSRLYQVELKAPAELRAAPDASSGVLGRRRAGERVAVLAERGEWAEVALTAGNAAKTAWLPREALGVPEVTPYEAMYVIGRRARVTGPVVSVRERGKVLTLGFGNAEKPLFTGVVFERDQDAFKEAGIDLAALVGKRVRLEGEIKTYTTPQLVLNRPTQLTVLD
jgi:phosphatidylserine/phosphatidylglycerophosphate/cardiolipin synthase-like enzyme